MPDPRLILYFPQSNASYELKPGDETVAGLSELCDLDLRRYFGGQRLRTISRLHFKIVYIEDGGYAIVDLSSLNGTRINDELLLPGVYRVLRNGDYITLANSEEFVIAVVADVSTASEIFADVPRTQTLQIESPSDVGLRYIHGLDQFVVDGHRIPHSHLSPLEHTLLRYLYIRAGRICSYDDLARNVWGYQRLDAVQNNTISKTVSNLRKKLSSLSDGSGHKYIATIHGRGVKCRLLPAQPAA